MIKSASFLMHAVSKILIVSIILSMFYTCTGTNAWAEEIEEYAVKAAFVFNFIKFIQWPKTSFSHDDSPYKLCFIGDAAVAEQFKKLDGALDGARKISVTHLFSIKKCKKCNILFISRNADKLFMEKIISRVKGKPVLTIGETKDFTKFGGIINFFLTNNRLHFEININAADQQGLKFSSRLLKLAVIVDGDK